LEAEKQKQALGSAAYFFFNFPLLPECVCWVCKNYDLQRALLKLYMASYGCARRCVVMR
jgi:hypothetical protein